MTEINQGVNMKKPENKTGRFYLVLEPKLKKDFERAATKDNTTMSDVVREFIQRYVNKVMK